MLSKDREGNVDIVIGLSNEEYKGLKAGVRWMGYADVIE